MKVKSVKTYEPLFFIFFGLFHMHRVWALFDRCAYADFWMGILENKGTAYFIIMGVLAGLCVLGIVTFIKNRKRNYWWRWVYIIGGGYVLFDLFAIMTGLEFWNRLLKWMFDVNSVYWNICWMFFILVGIASFVLGVSLVKKVHRSSV